MDLNGVATSQNCNRIMGFRVGGLMGVFIWKYVGMGALGPHCSLFISLSLEPRTALPKREPCVARSGIRVGVVAGPVI